METPTLEQAVATFGEAAGRKLSAIVASGEAEEQLRGPLETLIGDLAELSGLSRGKLTVIGETRLGDLKVRPDFAVSYANQLVGFIEVKAPGKGADPRRFKDSHDKDQWGKLAALPNLLYTDGTAFSLWRSGERAADIVHLDGDIESSGKQLQAPDSLVALFANFFHWEPTPPRRPKHLATLSAGMCRLLRDEVREQLDLKSPALAHLAEDWRRLLFPEASDEEFADGFAQTVTFGLLLARARGIDLDERLENAAHELGQRHSLMGSALSVFTQSVAGDQGLVTSVATLRRVLSVVDWPTISKGEPEAWLYFYEDFLAEYDSKLRRRTGSYYTPAEVVGTMTRLVDEALRTRFGLTRGLAEHNVTVLDPAVGTGTYLLAVLRSIAGTITESEGEGAVPGAMSEALERIIGFELQLGPFAVAQLRVLAELADLQVQPEATGALRLYVADTLASAEEEAHYVGWLYEPIAESRRQANRIKRDEPVTVCVGNPPYRERSRDQGGWVERGHPEAGQAPILNDFIPPSDWGVGAHVKHLYNPYIYFWRWATWKVFDHHPDGDLGIVCFITVAGFVNGPGFQKMRQYLRQRGDAIWVIDCSPEGHQPPVNTRVFQGVQQPVCITLVARYGATDDDIPAATYYHQLARGDRQAKFDQLAQLGLDGDSWQPCPDGWREPFLPAARAAWTSYPELDEILRWSGSGIMPGRTWVVAPDKPTLQRRWDKLIAADEPKQRELMSEHPTDRTIHTRLSEGLPGLPHTPLSIAEESAPCLEPTRIGYRSFDRQWIIPDKRVINRPNPTLWRAWSDQQVHLTALHRTAPSSGPAVTSTALIPDLDHYHGRGGRAYPLWLDADATEPNIVPGLTHLLSTQFDREVVAEDVFAYLAALLAHPGYVELFRDDLAIPGLRVPLTANDELFAQAVTVGRRVLWLHTFGQRYIDADASPPRPGGPPQAEPAPKMVEPVGPELPEEMTYDPQAQQLRIGPGLIEPVAPAVWNYEVSGVNVLTKWFSYRRADRDRPVIGARRESPLLRIQSDKWLASYTTELLEILNVLTLLVELEPQQAQLLAAIVEGPQISTDALTDRGILPVAKAARKPVKLASTDQQALDL